MTNGNPTSSKRGLWLAIGCLGLAFAAYLAFGIFGLHTLFLDDEVSEAAPDFINASAESESESTDTEPTTGTAAGVDESAIGEDDTGTEEANSGEAEPDEMVAGTEATGTFSGQAHPTTGTANVFSDGGTQRILRLEDDFQSDNGPDLNVYLATSSEVGDDFIDLGDLKGNIGGQNYDVSLDVDLATYDTVVIWCVRFGVGFGYAELDVG